MIHRDYFLLQVPTDMLGLANLLTKIKKRLADGHRVLIHCFGGMGRAVLVGCCLLMDLDEDIEPAEVIDQVYHHHFGKKSILKYF